MPSHLELGIAGEQIAILYLQKNGYTVLDCNVRFGRDEIDIVAYDRAERMIVFVEVKTRSHNSYAYPIRKAVNYRKRRCLRRAISAWCIARTYDGPARLDVLCVYRGKVIEHLKEVGREFLD